MSARAAPALDRLLRPRAVAVVGGGAWCADVVRALRGIGFDGAIWPVHPTRSEVAGAPAYRDVAALPAAPDAAFIGVNRTATIEVMRALTQKGAGGAVCFASGFREATAERPDGAGLEDALAAAAGPTPFLGPNCYGFLNAFDGAALWPDVHGLERVERGVAIISQSSNIALNLTMQRRGLPIGYMITVGNQARIGMADIAAAALDDPRVTALGLYVEGVGDLRRFEAMARKARALGKPIVALKVGASAQARAATASHTASLAGEAAGATALFDRLGVGQVSSLSALLQALLLLHVEGPLASDRIASMSCSGGEACLMADSALAHGLETPPLEARQRAGLEAALGPGVALANPLDYHTYIWNDRAALTRCFAAMMRAPLGLGLVVLDFPKPECGDAGAWETVIDAIVDARAQSGAPIAALASLADTMPENVAASVLARGVAPLAGAPEALEAIAAAARIGAAWRAPPPEPLIAPDRATTAATLSSAATLTEAEAKDVLRRHGLDTPRFTRALTPDEAAAAADAIGYPVALKGEGAAHKTEAGLVALNLTDSDAVFAAAERMAAPGYLVEEMAAGGVAELLIGVTRDPAHGFLLTLAAGGVLTEILDDAQSLLLPASAEEIDAALGRLRIAPLLGGFRGAAAANRAAIVDAALAIQAAARAEAARLIELEVNPLICTPRRAVAVDALIRWAAAPEEA